MQKKKLNKYKVSRALAVIFTVNQSASGLLLMAGIPVGVPIRESITHQMKRVVIIFTSLKSKLS
ncbi:thioredoxin domain-containing protein, partial [Streptomyces caniscabiei]|uniref:hypothetical protein n=1 Tax=Streptomyces caniscabiei TaxID=2746961 RepID=UPI0038F66D98